MQMTIIIIFSNNFIQGLSDYSPLGNKVNAVISLNFPFYILNILNKKSDHIFHIVPQMII